VLVIVPEGVYDSNAVSVAFLRIDCPPGIAIFPAMSEKFAIMKQ